MRSSIGRLAYFRGSGDSRQHLPAEVSTLATGTAAGVGSTGGIGVAIGAGFVATAGSTAATKTAGGSTGVAGAVVDQFSLRTLMIGITLLAVPLGYVGWQAKIVRERATTLDFSINRAFARFAPSLVTNHG